MTRHASVHAAGVVIGDQPLVNLLPLKQDEDCAIVTQYAMGPVGDLGLLKMDFLGLKTLTVIRNTCEMVKQTRGIEVPTSVKVFGSLVAGGFWWSSVSEKLLPPISSP